jgi:hypothetical protein
LAAAKSWWADHKDEIGRMDFLSGPPKPGEESAYEDAVIDAFLGKPFENPDRIGEILERLTKLEAVISEMQRSLTPPPQPITIEGDNAPQDTIRFELPFRLQRLAAINSDLTGEALMNKLKEIRLDL